MCLPGMLIQMPCLGEMINHVRDANRTTDAEGAETWGLLQDASQQSEASPTTPDVVLRMGLQFSACPCSLITAMVPVCKVAPRAAAETVAETPEALAKGLGFGGEGTTGHAGSAASGSAGPSQWQQPTAEGMQNLFAPRSRPLQKRPLIDVTADPVFTGRRLVLISQACGGRRARAWRPARVLWRVARAPNREP